MATVLVFCDSPAGNPPVEATNRLAYFISDYPASRNRPAGDDYADLDEECRSHPAGAVKLRYANLGWLPFAGDGQNFVAIDFDPGPAGTVGQVINTGRDDMMRHVIATTFTGFLEFVARQFAEGRVVRSDTDDRWLQLAGDGEDLLTGLRPLLGLPASYEP